MERREQEPGHGLVTRTSTVLSRHNCPLVYKMEQAVNHPGLVSGFDAIFGGFQL